MLRNVQVATDTAFAPALGGALVESLDSAAAVPAERCTCHHCGSACPADAPRSADRVFCCSGCLTVFELLAENGLGQYYELGENAGVRLNRPPRRDQFAFLDEPAVRERIADFADEHTCRVTFRIPAIHCIACVWLLENLFRIKPGIGDSTVNFPRRECRVSFDPSRVRLSEVVGLLASLGYEPDFNLAALEERPTDPVTRRLWLRIGVAGFAFGNIMLVSIPRYNGLDSATQSGLGAMFGFLSFALALPVLVFSASDYWRAAWVSWRRRVLTIELPIAVGLVALFGQSAFEILSRRGDGYLDSLTGLVFFLLCGRVFQHKTYDRLSFDRDYRSFFPLSATRLEGAKETVVSLAQLAVGDRVILRHGELVPADARLVSGRALVDYSFVTGESEPVAREPGELLYAGGQQTGGCIEVETIKPVSQSYLTSLWSQDAFAKDRRSTLDNLTNQFSRRFTATVALVALAAAGFWVLGGDSARAMKAFVSVLIVACPCALALAAPFALGTAQRVLGRRQVFLKDPHVTEALARVHTIVFDKTGTLTAPGGAEVTFLGQPPDARELAAWAALARQSTHPYSVRLAGWLGGRAPALPAVAGFVEQSGAGVAGRVDGRQLLLGSAAWLAGQGVEGTPSPVRGAVVHAAIDGRYRGTFVLDSRVRPETAAVLEELAASHQLALLSGDGEREREHFQGLFPADARLQFNQSPLNKLGFVRDLQQAGHTVMMVGDGLNDAGALKQSDVGVAVVEQVGTFSPASDIILGAARVGDLPTVLRFSKTVVKVVRLSFLLSSVYNVAGVSIAAAGLLSPLVCAILMPLSSVTVVAFACGATKRAASRAGLTRLVTPSPAGGNP